MSRNRINPPSALNMREVYLQAVEELSKPYPSIKMDNWPKWSHAIGGFRPREFSIFCGPTGTGKTTFLANLSAQLLKQNVRQFVMSVETGHTDFMKRILSVLEGRDLNTGDPVPAADLANIHTKYDALLTSDTIEFSLYDNRVSVEQLMADVRYMVEMRGVKIVMIDNLNFFMDVTHEKNQVLEMDRVVHELVIFCKQVDVHMIMVMHPKKTDHGRVNSEFDIKGSSTAVQEAHNIFLFNRARQTKDGVITKYDREVTLNKMRRRGSHVGKTLVFGSEGTKYSEKGYYRSGDDDMGPAL
jgi:twinkle protein